MELEPQEVRDLLDLLRQLADANGLAWTDALDGLENRAIYELRLEERARLGNELEQAMLERAHRPRK